MTSGWDSRLGKRWPRAEVRVLQDAYKSFRLARSRIVKRTQRGSEGESTGSDLPAVNAMRGFVPKLRDLHLPDPAQGLCYLEGNISHCDLASCERMEPAEDIQSCFATNCRHFDCRGEGGRPGKMGASKNRAWIFPSVPAVSAASCRRPNTPTAVAGSPRYTHERYIGAAHQPPCFGERYPD